MDTEPNSVKYEQHVSEFGRRDYIAVHNASGHNTTKAAKWRLLVD